MKENNDISLGIIGVQSFSLSNENTPAAPESAHCQTPGYCPDTFHVGCGPTKTQDPKTC